jgi:hypothetical protein
MLGSLEGLEGVTPERFRRRTPQMPPKRFFRIVTYGLLVFCVVLSAHFSRAAKPPAHSELTAHEWGTFTSIAGHDGRAVNWQPLTDSNDLPGFVEHFETGGFKAGLTGTVRMETPVLYFYAPRAMTVSVKVSFARGVITEWYPHASRVEPTARLGDGSLYEKDAADGSIAWDSVAVEPSSTADFPREDRDSRYYAARETSAAPLRVKVSTGDQQEKFLFYRGVSAAPAAISATLAPDGDKVLVKNLGEEAIPTIVRFERRGARVGYSFGSAVQNEATLDAPELNGTLDSLDKDLEGMLVAQGLYPDEARAMVQTWGDSWFEEGSRLIYIVPARFVNTILPLTISPAPAQTVRVFVGRLELVTPATERAIATAFESRDAVTLRKYGRFLQPMLAEMFRNASDEDRRNTLKTYMSSAGPLLHQN